MQALLHLPIVNNTQDLRGLRKLVDTVLKNVDALEALGKIEAYYAGAVNHGEHPTRNSVEPQERARSRHQGGNKTDLSTEQRCHGKRKDQQEAEVKKSKQPIPEHIYTALLHSSPIPTICACSVARTTLIKPAPRSLLLLHELTS